MHNFLVKHKYFKGSKCILVSVFCLPCDILIFVKQSRITNTCPTF